MSLGSAIPSATMVDVAEQLLTRGQVTHPYLGVSLTALTAEIRERLGVQAPAGAVVVDVDPGGPAARAGLLAGDVITGPAFIIWVGPASAWPSRRLRPVRDSVGG